jgi:hypothetical protein
MTEQQGSRAGYEVSDKKPLKGVKVNPDYEILFRLMDGLNPDTARRYWNREQGAGGDLDGKGVLLGQIGTGVKIFRPVSHNALTGVEEIVPWRKDA